MHASPFFFLMLAAAVAVGGMKTTAAVLLAAMLHECAHLAVLRLFGAPVEGLRLGPFGAELYAGTRRLSYGRELAAVLAGPFANLVFAPFFARLAGRLGLPWLYLFAGAHVLLGIYNLLPIYPLDGSRAMYLAAAYFFGPYAAETICGAAGLAFASALCALGAYLTLHGGGTFFLIAALGLLFGAMRQFGIAILRSGV